MCSKSLGLHVVKGCLIKRGTCQEWNAACFCDTLVSPEASAWQGTGVEWIYKSVDFKLVSDQSCCC